MKVMTPNARSQLAHVKKETPNARSQLTPRRVYGVRVPIGGAESSGKEKKGKEKKEEKKELHWRFAERSVPVQVR